MEYDQRQVQLIFGDYVDQALNEETGQITLISTYSNNSATKAPYKKQRNKVVGTLRSSHAKYVNNEIGGNLESHPKRFCNKNPPEYSLPQFTPSQEPDLHREGPLLRNVMERPIQFFRLFFSNGMVDCIVLHTKTCAYLYVAGYSQLGATRLVGYLPSHIQQARME